MSKLLKVWKKEIFMNKHKGLFSSASYSELNIRYGMIKTKFSYRFKTVNILQSKTYMLDHNSSIMCRTTVQYITFPGEITRTYYQIII